MRCDYDAAHAELLITWIHHRTVVPHGICDAFPGCPDGEFRDRESYKIFFRRSFSEMSFDTLKTIATQAFFSAHMS